MMGVGATTCLLSSEIEKRSIKINWNFITDIIKKIEVDSTGLF